MKLLALPREHGAYVVLASSWIVGMLGGAPTDAAAATLLPLALLGILLTQGPLRLAVRGRLRAGSGGGRGPIMAASTLALGTLATGIVVAARHPAILWLLLPALPLAALSLELERRRAPLQLRSLAGFLALTLAAPAARIAGGSTWSLGELAGLWLTAALFFCGAVYCVNIRMAGRSAVRPALLYHGAIALVAVALAWNGLVAPALALGLGAAKLLWIVADVERYRALPLKRIGIQESIVSIVFIILNLIPLTNR